MTFNESSIRPDALFDKYLQLAENDCTQFFGKSTFAPRNCPVCGGNGSLLFEKNIFKYSSCNNCATLYINPCPDVDSFRLFYQKSSSAEYWSTTFYRETEANRKELLWRPKYQYIHDLMLRSFDHFAICDIGCGYGAFLDVAADHIDSSRLLGIEPNQGLSNVCLSKGHKIITKFLQEVNSHDVHIRDLPTIFTCFELLEHLADPHEFLQHLFNLMKPGDSLLFTTLSSFGIDIRLLGSDSRSISPPHHILFINPVSARLLASRIGFTSCAIDTPGSLDVNILRKNMHLLKPKHPKTYDFLNSLPASSDESFQNFLVENSLSSHIRVLLTK